MKKIQTSKTIGVLLLILALFVACSPNTATVVTPTPSSDSSIATPDNGENGVYETEEDVFETPVATDKTDVTDEPKKTGSPTSTDMPNISVTEPTPKGDGSANATANATPIATPTAQPTATDNGEIELPRIPWD